MRIRLLLLLLLSLMTATYAAEYYEGITIESIDIQLQTEDYEKSLDKKAILARMKTKKGDPFSQTIFDGDLKEISKDYDKIQHAETLHNGQLQISIKVWPRPTIRSINWQGNEKIKTNTLQSELDVRQGEIFYLQEFNEKFTKLKEYYIKKGYFESQLSYKIIPIPHADEVDIDILVHEGKSGGIQKIIYRGFSKEEKAELDSMLLTKKYNFLTSWLTGSGIYNQEMIENDRQIIINFLQNEGYADARVSIRVEDEPITGQIIVIIEAKRGQLYKIGKISFEGNSLLSNQTIENALIIRSGDPFSPEKIHKATQALKDLYGKDGYIEADIQYEARLSEKEAIYDLYLHIEEGEQFRIGMIHVFGNRVTKTRVILRESLLIPGDFFDSRKLKVTQARLQNIGYFKNVNVYAVKTEDDAILGPNYRDVYIEVEEGQTGSINVALGANSTDSVSGSLEYMEKNFNSCGIFHTLCSGTQCRCFSECRGGGEFLNVKATVGAKQQSYVLNWLNPYFRDSLWRVGLESSYTTNRLQSDAYKTITWGATLHASHPVSSYISYGNRYRFRHTRSELESKVNTPSDKTVKPAPPTVPPGSAPNEDGVKENTEKANHGLISAVGAALSYDSTNHPYKASKGLRSLLDAEFAGVGGDFFFFKTLFLNTYYYPITPWGALKLRADLKFLVPLWGTRPHQPPNGTQVAEGAGVPLSERFFLGGVDSVRGYKPYIIGPTFANEHDPSGGISSGLFSIEYNHTFLRILDGFIFFDSGNITMNQYSLPWKEFRSSYGFGIRLEILGQAPVTLGWGFPINPERESDVEGFFFSMGARF